MRNPSYFLFIIAIILFLFLEFSIFQIPLIFIFSVIILALYRSPFIFILVFVAGLLLDSLRVTNFGVTPIFIFSTFLIIHLYERYFGSSDFIVISLITIFATFIYAFVLSYSVFSVILMFILLAALFYIFEYLIKRGIL